MARVTGEKLNCAHIVGTIADPSAGTSHSVPALCNSLARLGVSISIETIAGWRATPSGRPPGSLEVALRQHRQSHAALPLLRSLCASTELKSALLGDLAGPRLIHVHGLWLLPNVYPAQIKFRTGAKIIHSTRGMLGREAMEYSGWKKRAFWTLWQKKALQAADCLHATSQSELAEIRSAGLSNPVAVIPNGVELPDLPAQAEPRDQVRTVLSLGRLHPKKGLESLIRAWAVVEHDFPDWRLRIVGPSENHHDQELRSVVNMLRLKRVAIEGPLIGPDRLAAYRGSDLFVLPSRNENFAMTVAEALAAEVPVISTKGAPWQRLATEGCGWWIDHGVEAVAASLRHAMSKPHSELRSMGEKGRAWMTAEYGWNAVAESMLEVYSWLALASDRPASVELSP